MGNNCGSSVGAGSNLESFKDEILSEGTQPKVDVQPQLKCKPARSLCIFIVASNFKMQ